jgi:hypothetical protein
VIVRLLTEGQYRIADGARERLNELDDRALAALDSEDEEELDRTLEAMWDLVKTEGEALPHDDLSASDVIVPPADLTLEETRRLFSEDGLIPDLPAA